MAGGHASTWAPEWGATWQRVGKWRAHGIVGPGKIVGGGNAKALHCPLIYMRYSSPFPPCGTEVPRSLTFAGHVAAQRTSDAWALMEIRRCGGHRVHPIPIYSTCSNQNLSEEDLPLIERHVDGSERLDLHRMDCDLH